MEYATHRLPDTEKTSQNGNRRDTFAIQHYKMVNLRQEESTESRAMGQLQSVSSVGRDFSGRYRAPTEEICVSRPVSTPAKGPPGTSTKTKNYNQLQLARAVNYQLTLILHPVRRNPRLISSESVAQFDRNGGFQFSPLKVAQFIGIRNYAVL